MPKPGRQEKGLTALAQAAYRPPPIETVLSLAIALSLLSIRSFAAALNAFRLMEAARVLALRETAIVFAALPGWRHPGEGFGLRRTLAAGALAAGLVLVQPG